MTGKRRTGKGGTRGTVYEAVARMRLEHAAILLNQGRCPGAVYLAGYAIECMLKYAVTRNRRQVYLPGEFELHDWDTLLQAAGLAHTMRRESALLAVYSELADRWGPELRYLSGNLTRSEAKRLYQQTKQVYDWIVERVI